MSNHDIVESVNVYSREQEKDAPSYTEDEKTSMEMGGMKSEEDYTPNV